MMESELPPILVVDDNHDNAEIIRQYLEIRGYPITVAHDGDEALALFEQVRPALVLLDVMMPGRDGWETLQQLKNRPATAGVPVIMCSVLREAELAHFLGAAELVPKPVMREALLAALRRLGLLPLDPPARPAGRRSSA